jgi:hypothetical protein
VGRKEGEESVTHHLIKGDCIEEMNAMPAGSVDLTFGSPPYEKARLYLEDGTDLGIARDTEEWVAWMVDVFRAALRVTKGLVAFVVEGQTVDFCYSCGPALLIADLRRQGISLRKPPLYVREGIPGSGGPDWLKNKYEWIICATNGGKLPWSDNTVMGHKPEYERGGRMSNRSVSGARRFTVQTRREKDGNRQTPTETDLGRPLPDLANPGNLIDCGANTHFGIGNKNEAHFPEKLAEFFVRSFCPPGGTCLDPFSGSGTTAAVAVRYGRNAIGIDLRESQINLARRRIAGETPLELLNGA